MNAGLAAEWLPQAATLLAWPANHTDWKAQRPQIVDCYRTIIQIICTYQPVWLLVPANEAYAVSSLFGSIESPRLKIIPADYDDTWCRDYGPITLQNSSAGLHFLDFTFNGWGGKFPAQADNTVNRQLAELNLWRKPRWSTIDFELEGGAIESDGTGTLLTTWHCLHTRHPQLSRQAIEQRLRQYCGAKRILWLEHGLLAGDDTDGHIDTLARFIDPCTIAFQGCRNTRDQHYPALTEMAGQLAQMRRPGGQTYRLVELPLPEPCYNADGHRLPASYANFLFINGALLVPSYGVPSDEQAVSVLQNSCPDRKVLAVPCRPLIEQHGSLHCITMQLYE